MWIDIRTRGLRVDDNMRLLVNLRLGYALGRVRDHVRRVGVYLSDENGPRGGVDKGCRVVAVLSAGYTVVVDARDAHLREVIDRAADRAGEAVRRALGRLHDVRHRAAHAGGH